MNLNDLQNLSNLFSNTEKMPILFLGHGSPMNAVEENQFVQGFRKAALEIPKPNAILCISAHWLTNGTKVTAMSMPRTIHDFGGFRRFCLMYNILLRDLRNWPERRLNC